MYCTKCGKEVMESSVICPNCGTSVRKEKAAGKNLKWLVLGGALVAVIATFMPAVSFMGESLSFMNELIRTEGIGIIILSLVAGLLGYFQKARMCSFIPAIFNIYVVFYDLSPVIDRGASWGFGAILIILSNIAIIVGSIMQIVSFVKAKKNPLS